MYRPIRSDWSAGRSGLGRSRQSKTTGASPAPVKLGGLRRPVRGPAEQDDDRVGRGGVVGPEQVRESRRAAAGAAARPGRGRSRPSRRRPWRPRRPLPPRRRRRRRGLRRRCHVVIFPGFAPWPFRGHRSFRPFIYGPPGCKVNSVVTRRPGPFPAVRGSRAGRDRSLLGQMNALPDQTVRPAAGTRPRAARGLLRGDVLPRGRRPVRARAGPRVGRTVVAGHPAAVLPPLGLPRHGGRPGGGDLPRPAGLLLPTQAAVTLIVAGPLMGFTVPWGRSWRRAAGAPRVRVLAFNQHNGRYRPADLVRSSSGPGPTCSVCRS